MKVQPKMTSRSDCPSSSIAVPCRPSPSLVIHCRLSSVVIRSQMVVAWVVVGSRWSLHRWSSGDGSLSGCGSLLCHGSSSHEWSSGRVETPLQEGKQAVDEPERNNQMRGTYTMRTAEGGMSQDTKRKRPSEDTHPLETREGTSGHGTKDTE